MKAKDFEDIKEKIEEFNNKKSHAEGALQEIMGQLSEFGVSSIEEAEKLLLKIESEIENDEKKLDILLKELEKITDWDAI